MFYLKIPCQAVYKLDLLLYTKPSILFIKTFQFAYLKRFSKLILFYAVDKITNLTDYKFIKNLHSTTTNNNSELIDNDNIVNKTKKREYKINLELLNILSKQ